MTANIKATDMGRMTADLWAAWLDSGLLGYLLVAVWLILPFAFVEAFHFPVALVALAAVFLLQLGIVILIYRRLQYFVPIWPLAALVGVLGDGIWWLVTGLDPVGVLTGFLPAACSVVCERLGRDFVFGPGPKEGA